MDIKIYMKVLQLQEIIVQVTIQLAPTTPFANQAFNLVQTTPDVTHTEPIEALLEFGSQLANGIVVIQVKPVEIVTRKIKQLAQPSQSVTAIDAVAWLLEKRSIKIWR